MDARAIEGARRRCRAPLACASLAALAAALGACSTGLLEDGRDRAIRIATDNGFTPAHVDGGQFTLFSASRARPGGGDRLVVYVEGDGRAWENRYVLASDPTPLEPMALKLAARDPAPLVAYLARPCQYTRAEADRACPSRYWSGHRYAPEVIAATGRVIDHYKSLLGAREVELVGYSGGGAVAALLAAERDDVVALTTVAAPLDHRAWTAHHGLSPMAGSLNPADFAAALAKVPQVHLVGADDSVVPPAVAEAYLAHLGDRSHSRLVRIEDFGHTCCWERRWPELRAAYHAS